MRNANCRTWNMARNLTNVENETHTLSELEYGDKTGKQKKLEAHIIGPGIQQEILNKNWKMR